MNERLGMSTLVVGCLALAGSVAWAFLSRSPDVLDLEAETASLRAELNRMESTLGALKRTVQSRERRVESEREDEGAAREQLQQVLFSDPRLAGDVSATIEDLLARIASVEREIVDGDLGTEPAAAPPTPPPPEAKPTSSSLEPRKADLPARELEERLERFNSVIVLVASSAGELATGLVVGRQDDKIHVLTIAAAVPHGADVKCFYQTSKTGDEEFQPIQCDVVYRDAHSALLLLEGSFETSSGFDILTQTSFDGEAPRKGDTLYAVGAHAIGTTAFTGSVFDGMVSSAESSSDGVPSVQTTLPVNEGTPGSVVVDAKGNVVGVLWRSPPGLDRVSTVLLAEAVRPVLERLRQHQIASNFGPRVLGDRTSSNAGRYTETLIDLGAPLSPDAGVFPGPDDLVLVWDRTAKRLTAYHSDDESPRWTIAGQEWTEFAYRPWQPYGFLSGWPANRRGPRNLVTVVVNTRTGRPKSRLSTELSKYFSRAWATFPMGKMHVLAYPKGFAISNLETGRAFALRNLEITLMAHVDDLLTVSTVDGNVGWLTRREFLTIITRIDTIYAEIEKILRNEGNTGERHRKVFDRQRQIEVLAGQLKSGVKIFQVPGGLGRRERPESSFCHVPGTYLHIVGRNVWKIGPDTVAKRGRLEPLWHSAFAESFALPRTTAMASPDGRYAVTGTHVYDLRHLEAIAELPFKGGPVGFTSSGQHIFAQDAERESLVFLPLAELIATAEGESARGDDDGDETSR